MTIKKQALNDWDKNFLKFLKKQDNEFLQKVKGLKIFFSEDFSNIKPIAKFSATGKQLHFFKQWTVSFDQSFSPNHGVYQMELYSHYIGILFHDSQIFIYSTYSFDDLFKVNGKRVYLAK